MKKQFYLIVIAMFCLISAANAAVGDTTWVQSFHGDFTQYGNFDTGVVFPSSAVTYRKIYMILTIGEYNCAAGSQYCHQWDYDMENYVMTPGGDTLEIARMITPYATSGTPGFTSAWQQHYIFDVTDYYPVLQGPATMRILYSGYSWGFSGDVKFAFIQGTPERNVLGHTRLWNGGFSYGDPTARPIDSTLVPQTITPPAGTVSTELKFAITGHGYDSTSGCCEFDFQDIGHTYSVLANNNTVAQHNMNMNCGMSELYPQGGTWLEYRVGNWCPGGYVTVAQYPLTGVAPGSPSTVGIAFDNSYYGGYPNGSANPPNYGGVYKIAGTAFYYGAYNKTLDASLEDVIAPTTFEWYRRENPRASVPVVKIRNTGGTTITSVLLQYGVQDSAMSQYIWTGSLAPSQDTTITLAALPALTNLSLNSATGTFGFIAEIVEVNNQTDNDQSNDTITSNFSVAPTWPGSFVVQMKTSTLGASGYFGQNPADASWQITDASNTVVASRTNANVGVTYNDTVTLNTSSFYTLSVSTTNCFGLNWYGLVGQTGYTAGSFAVKDYNNGNASLPLNGNNGTNGTFHDDFGCGFIQYFTTAGECQATAPVISRDGDTLFSTQGNSYQWYYNGVAIPGGTKSYFVMIQKNGNYTVRVTTSSSCSGTGSLTSTSDAYTVINLGLTNLYDQASVSIAPNPAADAFTLGVNSELVGTTYSISDLTGRAVTSGNVNATSNYISVAGMSPGIYLVTVTDGESSITKKVAVAR